MYKFLEGDKLFFGGSVVGVREGERDLGSTGPIELPTVMTLTGDTLLYAVVLGNVCLLCSTEAGPAC